MDERTQGFDDATVHRVDEREVRLAMDRLDLADRTLNVYRATAFLTALGITVSHDGALEPSEDDEPEATAGDVANLIEVQAWLRDTGPAMTVDQFRERRRVPNPHRRATA
jgi:hypothetical protein